MFFTGQKVILKYTGDTAVVQQILGNGMVSVKINFENMIIPVSEEDLLPEGDYTASLQSNEGLPLKQEHLQLFQDNSSEVVRKSLGLQLGFEAINIGDSIEKYNIYLINDTDSELLFIFKVHLGGKLIAETDSLIKGHSYCSLGEISYDHIAAIPEIVTEIRKVSTLGVGEPLSKSIKLKPASFFKSVATAPLLNRPVHHYVLFGHFEREEKQTKKEDEDIKSYTNRLISSQKKGPIGSHQHRKLQRDEIEELAHFSMETDLHIENLTERWDKMTNGEIIQLQLRHFEQYIDKAYRLGVERVFIIHGLGKGRLRDAIAERLKRDYRVVRFTNEYHPKYGFGATEVVLQ